MRAIGKGPQWRAVAGEDDLGVGREVGGIAAAGERGREELVGEEEACEHCGGEPPPAQSQESTHALVCRKTASGRYRHKASSSVGRKPSLR